MKFLDFYIRFNDWLEAGIRVLAAGLLAIIILLPFVGTIVRYVTGEGYTWITESPPQLVPWMVFPLIGVLLRHDHHISVDILPYLATRTVRNAIRAVVMLICTTGAIMFCVFGAKTVLFFMKLGEVSTTEVEFPLWYLYLSYPVGFALAANFSLEAFLRQIAGRAEPTDDTPIPALTE